MAPSHTSEWQGRHANKDLLRQTVWALLQTHQAVKRDPVGHIPNFVDAATAAAHLAKLAVWQQAQVVKCNPDAPQKPVRLQALEDGKLLYMAVPRLAKQHCFVALHRDQLAAQGIPLTKAANMRNALIYGKRVAFTEMQPIDLVVVGCVAVSQRGGRTGKGAGFADLELAMLREAQLVESATSIVTTVHELQIVEDDLLPMQRHDWPLDWIVTPKGAIATRTTFSRPNGLDWDALQPDQIEKIPILKILSQQRQIASRD
ncbi:MAG: 5-formyltetrahydrofolate cyclo-ligase [Leptolyngbya sp. SIOISBB]|nr:5-formyltetrahydrofolate cyclo-ligase [Leptolyngbya sp. SIOISBB]